MGRPKGSRNKPKARTTEVETTTGEGGASTAAASGERNPGIGDNSQLTDEQRTVLLYQHKRRYADSLQAKKTADALLKNVCKVAKAELGEDAVAEIKLMIEAETEEGEEAIKAAIELRTRVLRMLGVPVAQTELFPSVDPTPAEDRAEAEGRRAGMAGETCRPPYDPSVPQHGRWITGWHKGQELLVMNKLKPIEEEEERPELIPAGEQERRDAERMAEHNAAQAATAPDDDFGDTVDEQQRRMRVEAGLDHGLASLAAEQRATIGDRKPTLREVN
ncbi:hypothetical protein [Rhodoplanes serenus]|uniref:hypothetical protein n=1 Tax=Rhodoplanes serenus TaxID=200615 RepID=UPI000DAC1700|nr:hypothetical protein [Rhodoplanes serenus]RAI33731.1 hypothetical protein CH340_11320 [Rhodoplanes serenus]